MNKLIPIRVTIIEEIEIKLILKRIPKKEVQEIEIKTVAMVGMLLELMKMISLVKYQRLIQKTGAMTIWKTQMKAMTLLNL